VRTATFNFVRLGMRSHWRLMSASEIWSPSNNHVRKHTIRPWDGSYIWDIKLSVKH